MRALAFNRWAQGPAPVIVDKQPAVRPVEDHSGVNPPALRLVRNHGANLAVDEAGVAGLVTFAAVDADQNSGVIDTKEDAVGAVGVNGDGGDDRARGRHSPPTIRPGAGRGDP